MTDATAPAAQENQPTYNIEKIYVKDLSLEVPNAPSIFLERDTPSVDVQLHHMSKSVDDGIYQTELTITVTAKIGEKTMFLAEANLAGIFQIRNVPNQDLDPILGIGNPNILYPYARETISDMVTRAGFPPVLLNPVNFEALYQAQKAQEAGEEQPLVTTKH
ncbi:MAG: protein-export chaperone SecB [Betaproteobacteria bacterium]|jgi:preprotein translocase subunit SecB|nr:preprotein translocase subunit SecB [Betaproteobacteria bacterium UKL13-2]HCG53025.1 protein-export chaperone SecB [Betaproteobacteria bacterium]